MNALLFAYTVLLFVLLTPAILLSLPPKGGKWVVALVHGVVFTLVYHFTHNVVSAFGDNMSMMR